MDIILLAITVVSLIVALVMSVAAWRVTRDEKQRSAARVAALSLAASGDEPTERQTPSESSRRVSEASRDESAVGAASFDSRPSHRDVRRAQDAR